MDTPHWKRMLLVGCLGVLCCLPAGLFAAEYDPTPAPVNASPAALTTLLGQVKNNLFFLDDRIIRNSVDVEFDRFLLPNGSYATIDCAWAKLVSTDGNNILRPPTAKEQEQHAYTQRPCIYSKVEDAVPAYAQGQVDIKIPCSFAHVQFLPDELNTPKTHARMTATLLQCKANTASLEITGAGDEQPIVILRDATGGRLGVSVAGWTSNGESYSADYVVGGIIASIDVYRPVQYVSQTLDVLATAEPDTTKGIPAIKATRYVAGALPVKSTEVDPDTLQAQTSVVFRHGTRDPELVVQLPNIANSAFATVDFGTPALDDADGKSVAYYTESGPRDNGPFAYAIRFAGFGTPISRATGTVTIRYPGSVRPVSLTPAEPRDGAYAAQFSGPLVQITGIPADQSLTYSPNGRSTVDAVNAAGYHLRQLTYSGTTQRDNATWYKYTFWGTPTEVRLVSLGNWQTLTIPFDLVLQ